MELALCIEYGHNMVSSQVCDNIKLNGKHDRPEFCYSKVAVIPWYTFGRNGSHDGWAFDGKCLITKLWPLMLPTEFYMANSCPIEFYQRLMTIGYLTHGILVIWVSPLHG